MPAPLLACLATHARGTVMFDMVYEPLETAFLATARDNGGVAVDGLKMLVGQARAAFRLFFDQIGRASWRARVCPYVSISLDAVYLKKNNTDKHEHSDLRNK